MTIKMAVAIVVFIGVYFLAQYVGEITNSFWIRIGVFVIGESIVIGTAAVTIK